MPREEGKDEPRSVVAESVGGQFVARLCGPCDYSVFLLSVDGVEPLGVLELEPVSVRLGVEVRVSVPRPARPVLQLVDRATGEAIDRGMVVACPASEFQGTIGAEFDLLPRGIVGSRVYAASERGRVRLPAMVGRSLWFVGAKGHAWKAVFVSHEQVKPLTVPLVLGGALEIEVHGHHGREELSVTVSLDGQSTAAVPQGDKGPWLAAGLPAGRYQVLLATSAGEPYGEGVGTVRGGRVTRIKVAARSRQRSASVTVVVRHTEAWSIPLTRLHLCGVDDATPRAVRLRRLPGSGGVRADLVNLPVGWYEVAVEPILWCTRIHVLREGQEIELALPEPRTIELRLVDAASRLPITAALVRHLPRKDLGSPVEIPFDSEEEAFVHEFMLGTALLAVDAEGYVGALHRVNVTRNQADVVIALRKRR